MNANGVLTVYKPERDSADFTVQSSCYSFMELFNVTIAQVVESRHWSGTYEVESEWTVYTADHGLYASGHSFVYVHRLSPSVQLCPGVGLLLHCWGERRTSRTHRPLAGSRSIRLYPFARQASPFSLRRIALSREGTLHRGDGAQFPYRAGPSWI